VFKNTRKLLKSGEAAPPKNGPWFQLPDLACQKVEDHIFYVIGATGVFYGGEFSSS